MCTAAREWKLKIGAERRWWKIQLTFNFTLTRFIAEQEEEEILNVQNYCFSAKSKNFPPVALKKNYSFFY